MPAHRFPRLKRAAIHPKLYGSDRHPQMARRLRRGATRGHPAFASATHCLLHFRLSLIYHFFHFIAIFCSWQQFETFSTHARRTAQPGRTTGKQRDLECTHPTRKTTRQHSIRHRVQIIIERIEKND
jgi:hypothetical protein